MVAEARNAFASPNSGSSTLNRWWHRMQRERETVAVIDERAAGNASRRCRRRRRAAGRDRGEQAVERRDVDAGRGRVRRRALRGLRGRVAARRCGGGARRPHEPRAAADREAADAGLSFRIPEVAGAFPDENRLALVRRFVRGVELELRIGRQAVKPWAIVGEIAAAVHAVPGTDVEDIVPGAATRREHALEALSALAELGPVEMRDAHAWALDHLPPAEPSALLHGDLLGQNILLSVDSPRHVIDWEYARTGDPAYDLAIVTRGVKRPFQIDRGWVQIGSHPE
jgi:hypothetical protein